MGQVSTPANTSCSKGNETPQECPDRITGEHGGDRGPRWLLQIATCQGSQRSYGETASSEWPSADSEGDGQREGVRQVHGPLAIAVVPIAAMLLCAQVNGSDWIKLSIIEGKWEGIDYGAPPGEGAVFAIGQDPERGPCLVVGPRRQGEWIARFRCREALPYTRGTVRGFYRTEGIEPYGVAVTVEYMNSGKRVATRDFWLGPAPEWREFGFVFRVPPPVTDSVVVGFGLAGTTHGNVHFADLAVSPDAPPLSFPSELPAVTRAAPPTDLKATGFFRTEKVGDTWWLVTPRGRAFYSVGVDAPWFHVEEATAGCLRQAADRMRAMGFNSFAGWTDVSTWGPFDDELAPKGEPTFGPFATIETGTDQGSFDRLRDARGKDTGGTYAFPDPFDPRFDDRYRARAHRVAEIVEGKPWFIAWFADNEVSHRELYRHVYSPHCAAALRGFLQARYGDVSALNRAWHTGFTSVGDIPEKIAEIPSEGPIYDDLRLFEREVIKRYVQVTLSAIRAEDPDHLVFSNRFMLDDVTAWMGYLDLYLPYDGIAVNIYPSNQRPGLDEEGLEVLRLVYEKARKPMIIGEWSVPAADSGLYESPDKLDWSWNEVVPTQADRARQAAQVAVGFYNLPFLVGAHWFIWQDVDSEERQANRGLFKANGEPWSELIAALTAAHKAMGPAVEPE